MADEQEILEAPEVDQDEQEGDGPGPQPALSEESRKKLDSIVSQMSANKETDDAIKTVVEDFKKKYSASPLPKLDYRKPVQQAPITEAKGQNVPQNISRETNDQQLIKRHGQAITTLDNELQGNNDLIPGLIKSQKAKSEQTAGAAQFSQKQRSDAPLTTVQQLGISLQPKPQEPEVTDQDVSDFMQNIQYNPEAGKAFLQHVATAKPEKAKAIQEATYVNDAMNRLSQDPNASQKGNKVIQNAQKIAKGDLHYSVQGGMLIKPEDVWQSIGTGLQQKNKAFADYDLFNKATPDVAIQELEKRRAEHDPDEPIPVPKGFLSELSGGMAGQPIRGLIAGKVVGGATALIPGAEEFSPAVDKFVTAAQSGDDFRKISYAHSLQQNYNQLRNDGVTPELAYAQAQDVAKKESLVDAAAGAAMMYGAGAIGDIKLPSFAASNGYKAAVTTALKQGAKGVGEAGAVGLIQGAAQQAKNDIKDEASIVRDYSGKDIGEAIESGALFTLGMAVVAKGGSLLSKKVRTDVLQGLSKATPDQVKQELGNQIIEKHITPEEAVKAEKEIDEHRKLDQSVPSNITQENRLKILDKIDRRKELENQLETKDKAYHPEIKEKIKAINEDILELSKNKIPKGENSEIVTPEPTTSESAVEKPTEDAGNDTQGAASSISAGDVIISKHLEGPQQVRSVSEDGKTVFVEGSADHHVHEIPIEEITLSVKKNAGVPENQAPIEGQQNPELGAPAEEPTTPQPSPEQPPGEQQVPQPTAGTEEPAMTGITHAQTDEVARQLGFDTYEQKPETIAEWDAEADKRLREDPQTISKLLNKLEDGHEPDKIDQRVMVRHLSSLKARIEENPTDALLAEYKRAKDLSDIMGGREVAKSLVARRGSVPIKDSLADYLTEEMDSSGVDQLTEEQKAQNKKEYDEISKAKDDYEKKIEDLEKENAKLKAESEIKKTSKESSKKGIKKTSEDYAKERKDILADMRADLLKAAKGQGGLAASVPGAAQLGAIAPHVAKLVKSLVEEGYDKLEDIVKNIHGDLKDVVEGITEKDVHDIIAGEHNEKKATKNELAAKLKGLRDEAALINKLERLKNGEEPKNEKNIIERNKEITDLKKQIEAFKKENKNPVDQLNDIKARNEKELKDVQEKIAKGDYGPEEKKTPILENAEVKKKYPNLFKEVEKSADALIAAKKERALRLAKQEYENRPVSERRWDTVKQIWGLRRAINTAFDFSVPFRQAARVTMNPLQLKTTGKAFSTMFSHTFSPKAFDRWFFELENSSDYANMQKDKLYISSPDELRLSKREEQFQTDLASKIPLLKAPFNASQRAASAYLNEMRVDLYRKGVSTLEGKGLTREKNPEAYEALAKLANNLTGRGNLLSWLEGKPANALSQIFYGPRLMASKFNLLNPVYYYKMPPKIRRMALTNMAGYVGFYTSIGLLANAAGATVSLNPDDPDFLKIKIGDTKYDITGGEGVYVRTFLRVLNAAIDRINGDETSLKAATKAGSSVTSMFRNKLAPNVSYGLNAFLGKTSVGQPFNPTEALKYYPMWIDDIVDDYNQHGAASILVAGVPSVFGIGVQTYVPKGQGGDTGGGGAGGSYQIKQWK